MNRYPAWKYVLIVIALLLGALYTAPNYFADSPALQVTTGKTTLKVNSDTAKRVEDALKAANMQPKAVAIEGEGSTTSVRIRFGNTDEQFNAKQTLEKALNTDPSDPDYIVTVNLAKNTPRWMAAMRALPLNLGLDLRGGVHFLLQVDAPATAENKIKGIQSSVRSQLRDKNVLHSGISRAGSVVEVKFRDDATRIAARNILAAQSPDLAFADAADGAELKLIVSLKPEALKRTL
ncbi:MAG: protein translocase subunit SecD, partial [Bdellovibrionales bacterium]|nr:protein translocase subunit SecD [Massilia sp.]